MATLKLKQTLNIHIIHCEFGYWMDNGEFTSDPMKATIYMDNDLLEFDAADLEVITSCKANIVTITLMPTGYKIAPFSKRTSKTAQLPNLDIEMPKTLIN